MCTINTEHLYPTKSGDFGTWNGYITLRHDCNCEFDCGQIHICFVTAEERKLLEIGEITYDELSQTLDDGQSRWDCNEQAFIVQALVDFKIPPDRWCEFTPILEHMSKRAGGFTMDHRDQLHPDIYMGNVPKSPIVQAVQSFIKDCV